VSEDTPTIAADRLKQIVEHIESLEDEKQGVADDIKAFYAEAKAEGFDTKILRKLIAMRKKSRDELEEEEALLDLYRSAVEDG